MLYSQKHAKMSLYKQLPMLYIEKIVLGNFPSGFLLRKESTYEIDMSRDKKLVPNEVPSSKV